MGIGKKNLFNFASPCIRQLVFCRYTHKLNVSKPRIAPLPRRILEAVTQPIVPSILDSESSQNCSLLKSKHLKAQTEDNNQYEQYLIRKCQKMFTEFSPQIIAIYQPLTMQFWPLFEIRNKFLRKGLELHIHYEEVLRKTIIGSKWQNLSPLLEGRLLFMVGKDVKISELLLLSRQTPQLLLLGAVIENRILTREALVKYSQLPSMDVLLADTVATLNSQAARLTYNLSLEQFKLITNLKSYSSSQDTS